MISFLQGQILHCLKDSMVINVNGVGYSVFVPLRLLEKFKVGQAVEFHTHHQVREDSHDLFGFVAREELELFKQLLTVKGVGPKTALSVLNQADAGAVSQSIASGDAALLARVAGISVKNAERIVIDLKNKVVPLEGSGDLAGIRQHNEVIEALVSLGYSLNQAQLAAKSLSVEGKDTSALLKEALRGLGGGGPNI